MSDLEKLVVRLAVENDQLRRDLVVAFEENERVREELQRHRLASQRVHSDQASQFNREWAAREEEFARALAEARAPLATAISAAQCDQFTPGGAECEQCEERPLMAMNEVCNYGCVGGSVVALGCPIHDPKKEGGDA